MFNASELEGEVDHSFFDSDCDNSTRGGGGGKTEKGLKAKKQSPSTHQRSPAKNDDSTDDGLSPRTRRTDKHKQQVGKNKRSRGSAASPASCTTDKSTSDKSDSEDDSKEHSKRVGGTFLALLADTQDRYDGYTQSPNEMGEKALTYNANQKRRNEQLSRKLMKSRHTRNPSPSSAEASADADSESSCSNRRSNLGSPTLPKHTKCSHPGVRRTRVGSAGSRDAPNSSSDESDDTVTDVSPLSSPEYSCLQSLDLNNSEVEEGRHEEQQEESVPSSGLNIMTQEEDSYQDIDERSLSLESQLGHKPVFDCPGRRYRKNYSFTNDEVRRIDRENQRLLRELSRLSPGSRPGSAAGNKIDVASNKPLVRLSNSALNRKRELQRIERDNLAFLKRLESVKPSQGLSRSQQLADYQRQVEYLGHSSCPIHKSTTKKERVSSRTSSGSTGHRTVSARAASSTDSSSTLLPRSKKLNAAQPPW